MYLVGILVSTAAFVGELLRSALRSLLGRVFAKTVPWNVWAKCRISHMPGQPYTSRRADNQTQQDPVPGISPLSSDHRTSYSLLQVNNSKTSSSHKALHPLNLSRLNAGKEEAADHGE
uniref:Putative secreted protein n=1 Tax=Ixodes ricinus TaxID=34613 RepID=A0A6B0UME8_IXORI